MSRHFLFLQCYFFSIFALLKFSKMTKQQKYLTIIFGIIFSLGLYDYLSHFEENRERIARLDPLYDGDEDDTLKVAKKNLQKPHKKDIIDLSQYIDELTDESIIIDYVKRHHKLPKYYIKKAEARKNGWEPSRGNLCEVLPGKAIGGDKFSNREGKLPKNEQYYEADVNYQCGKRNTDRIVFNSKGEVWLTKDHYKTFIKM